MSSDQKREDGAPADESADETIIDVSAQISHDIVDGAKTRASEIAHLPLLVLRFLRNPFQFVRQMPDLKMVTWAVLAVASGVAGAIVNGVINQSPFHFAIALLVLPIGALLAVFGITSILKLVFRGAHGLRFRYRNGAAIFAFTNLFWWIPIGAAGKIPPLALIGFYTSLIIASVGFVDGLHLPKPLVLRWFAILAVAHTVLWSLGQWISG